MTELGRRTGVLAGAITFIACLLTGILTNSDLVMSTIFAVIGAFFFGMGGLLIGNMVDGYVAKAFKRELAKQVIEKDIADATRRAAKEQIEPYEAEPAEEEESE